MGNTSDQKKETDELAEVTPFDAKDTAKESAFKSGNMFVETSAVQADASMTPWQKPE